ncbi:MAG: erythromycin esterase family protein [Cytophagaceae bacterium]
MNKPTTRSQISLKQSKADFAPLESSKDLDILLEEIGNSRYVLLGEATHGTHEFYTWRTAISKRLIEEKGFNLIAVEGDWPDCYKINRWIKGYKDSGITITEVLQSFKRWPTWMWANYEVAALSEWLREYNSNGAHNNKIGFYGLDVYSLWESMEILVEYLEKEDPKTASYSKEAFRCFEPYREEDSYANAIGELDEGCRKEVLDLLLEVRKNAKHYNGDKEAGLNAEMNALVIKNAEKYYTAMMSFSESSWNVRDQHMVETLDHIMKFHGSDAKVIVWEHNTHIGDARATDMHRSGLLNVGQLVRERHGKDGVYIVGFGTYKGTVIAGSGWGAPMKKMKVPNAKENSVEDILHNSLPENKLLIFGRNNSLNNRFESWLGHRAIGVVYHPEMDKRNYVSTKLSERYDAFIFIDETSALHPLHIVPDAHLIPETYPFNV